ncbi:hypothetical protein [Cellulosimicrobium cellulans]|uniref:hypothetical protein n=1 Tax=Cellulosimicrobium cellulans TaxID=1710 RepID=UPI000848DC45|nr:hypothetical protein [Cellulosimicrobium cellulans]
MAPGPFRTVVRWTGAGVAVPCALLAMLGATVAVAGAPEGPVSVAGTFVLAVLFAAPTGAIVGALAGVAHVVVRRRRAVPVTSAAEPARTGERASSGN